MSTYCKRYGRLYTRFALKLGFITLCGILAMYFGPINQMLCEKNWLTESVWKPWCGLCMILSANGFSSFNKHVKNSEIKYLAWKTRVDNRKSTWSKINYLNEFHLTHTSVERLMRNGDGNAAIAATSDYNFEHFNINGLFIVTSE